LQKDAAIASCIKQQRLPRRLDETGKPPKRIQVRIIEVVIKNDAQSDALGIQGRQWVMLDAHFFDFSAGISSGRATGAYPVHRD
jgi:hypothetical protein